MSNNNIIVIKSKMAFLSMLIVGAAIASNAFAAPVNAFAAQNGSSNNNNDDDGNGKENNNNNGLLGKIFTSVKEIVNVNVGSGDDGRNSNGDQGSDDGSNDNSDDKTDDNGSSGGNTDDRQWSNDYGSSYYSKDHGYKKSHGSSDGDSHYDGKYKTYYYYDSDKYYGSKHFKYKEKFSDDNGDGYHYSEYWKKNFRYHHDGSYYNNVKIIIYNHYSQDYDGGSFYVHFNNGDDNDNDYGSSTQVFKFYKQHFEDHQWDEEGKFYYDEDGNEYQCDDYYMGSVYYDFHGAFYKCDDLTFSEDFDEGD
ncbi:MAG TPA: hypothetical protein VHA09_04515 [Nitrososphaera sp.]|nr:hypothetical protein [Nitrososphaera sp.]